MVPELEKPRITEIQVRMDCNGCVQKIKKALHGINGIYDLYIDFPHQKLTIIGWADPEKIVKAIRKTRKIATICSHTDPNSEPAAEQPQQTEQQPQQAGPEGSSEPAPASEPAANPPPAEAAPPPAEAEPPKVDPPPPENHPPPSEEKPSPSSIAEETNNANQPTQPPAGPKDVGEVHVIYHHPPSYGYRYSYGNSYTAGNWNRYHNSQGFQQEPPPQAQPIYVTHSYNTHGPSPYVTEYQYVRNPSPPRHTIHSRMDYYNEDYHELNRGGGNGNITSMFSDENPNACTIV